VQIRPDDDLFYGISGSFGQYVPTGVEQARTPFGHYALMVGLRAWADAHPRARALYDAGLRQATGRHPLHAVGATGAYAMALPAEGVLQFDARADVGSMFLWALAQPGETGVARGSSICRPAQSSPAPTGSRSR
jgi:hypothetical protein